MFCFPPNLYYRTLHYISVLKRNCHIIEEMREFDDGTDDGECVSCDGLGCEDCNGTGEESTRQFIMMMNEKEL